MGIRTISLAVLAVAASVVVGCIAILSLRRAFGVEAPPREEAPRRGARTCLGAVSERVSRLIPASARQLGDARDTLMRTGVDISPSILWTLRVVCAAGGLAVGALLGLSLGGMRGAALAVIAFLLGAIAPQLWLLSRRSRWRSEIEAQLPDALDLMTISMSAGSSFDAAIRCVADEMDGALARGFRQVSEEAGYTSRAEALKRLADRAQVPSLTVFVASLTQAEVTGSSLVEILRSQADVVRKQRRLAVEEKASALSAKMLLPMIAFIFPCFILIIATPMFFVLLEKLGG